MHRVCIILVLLLMLLSQVIAHGKAITVESRTPPSTCSRVCREACIRGTSCQADTHGCMACRPTPSQTTPTTAQSLPTTTTSPTSQPTSHCTSNEGNPVYPPSGLRVECNSCTCEQGGVIGICTLMACTPNKCWDDQGKSYGVGEIITRGCRSGTCTTDTIGKATWTWYDPSTSMPPNCAYGNATYNSNTCTWACPSTCSNGSTPNCLIQPCATTSCPTGMTCVDNYCPNYPILNKDRCTAKCVTPVNCLIDPCRGVQGQPSKCGTGQTCQADYRFGCGYTCSPTTTTTCTYNNHIYHINDTFPSSDGCNICTCLNSGVTCTLRACTTTSLPTRTTVLPVPPTTTTSPTSQPTSHCTSNEGNPVYPPSGMRVECNSCTCEQGGVVGICTLMACPTNKCWDEQGKSYGVGETITRGCRSGTCRRENRRVQWVWTGCSP